MHCRDCGNGDRFVLFVELSVILHPNGRRSEPGGTFGVQCPTCAGTDVDGAIRRLVRRLLPTPGGSP